MGRRSDGLLLTSTSSISQTSAQSHLHPSLQSSQPCADRLHDTSVMVNDALNVPHFCFSHPSPLYLPTRCAADAHMQHDIEPGRKLVFALVLTFPSNGQLILARNGTSVMHAGRILSQRTDGDSAFLRAPRRAIGPFLCRCVIDAMLRRGNNNRRC